MPLFNSFDLWSIGGLVVGIASLILAIVLYYRGKTRKILEYEMYSTNLITKDMANIPGISISLHGKPIANLISTTIKFTNSGNQPILSNDFAVLEPLGISTEGQFFNTNQAISVYSDNPNSIPHLNAIDTEDNRQYIQIDVDFLKPKQSIYITLLHDDSLSISGDLKTGKKVREKSNVDKSGTAFWIFATFFGIITTLLGISFAHHSKDIILATSNLTPNSIQILIIPPVIIALSIFQCLFAFSRLILQILRNKHG